MSARFSSVAHYLLIVDRPIQRVGLLIDLGQRYIFVLCMWWLTVFIADGAHSPVILSVILENKNSLDGCSEELILIGHYPIECGRHRCYLSRPYSTTPDRLAKFIVDMGKLATDDELRSNISHLSIARLIDYYSSRSSFWYFCFELTKIECYCFPIAFRTGRRHVAYNIGVLAD